MTGLEDNIETLIPQRPPFVMIDQLTWHDEKITRTGFLIKEENVFVENGRLGEPGILENIAQTAAARAGYISTFENKPVQVGYIGAIKNLVIYSLPLVNEELVTEITLVNQIFDVLLIKGKVTCKEILLAECEMKIFIAQSK